LNNVNTQILLPKLGFSMNEGNLSAWLVADGACVKEGEPLYALESEKSVQEIESPASGILKILLQSGQVYPVGAVLGEILLNDIGTKAGGT
jgi:pyruvate/2-oxoglutarate dehydrogenase complex dihydrolipoamide acyltransferase (E2) component